MEKAIAMREATSNHIANLESTLGIKQHWTTLHPEYVEYYQNNVLTDYQKAVDELEQLVVMWLFELTKMSVSVL